MCFSPVVIDRSLFDCGRCLGCLNKRRRDWTLRIEHEAAYWKDVTFLTLTYKDSCLPENASLSKRDVQLFIKRLRYYSRTKIKYYATGEYGKRFGRPHYHLILFGISPKSELFHKAWTLGFIKTDYLTPDRIRYVTKYVLKELSEHGRAGKYTFLSQQKLPPFRLVSGGFGLRYLIDNYSQLVKDKACRYLGRLVALPRYYRKKLLLTASCFSDIINKKLKELELRFFDVSDLSPSERVHYQMHGFTSILTYRKTWIKYKAYLRACHDSALARFRMNI